MSGTEASKETKRDKSKEYEVEDITLNREEG